MTSTWKVTRLLMVALAFMATMALATPQAGAIGGIGADVNDECVDGPLGEDTQCVTGTGEWLGVVCGSGGCVLEFECAGVATGGTAASTAVDECTAVGVTDGTTYSAPPVALNTNAVATLEAINGAPVQEYEICWSVAAQFNVGGRAVSEGCTDISV